MNDRIIRPTTIQQLEEYVTYRKKLLDKGSKDYQELENWIIWFHKNKSKLEVSLCERQYFKYYYNQDNIYSLQVWKSENDYDIISYIAMANYNDEFCNDKTIITE